MKKYLASFVGLAAFVGFVAYATVQTKPKETQKLPEQVVLAAEDIQAPSGEIVVLPAKLPTPSVTPVNIAEIPVAPSPVITATVAASVPAPIITSPTRHMDNDERDDRDREEENDD